MNDPQAPVPSLIVQHTGQYYPLSQAPVTIGSATDNRIILSDPNVSSHHAALSWQSGTYVLQDLGSTDGTYVNEWRIATPQPLYDGDVIRVGDTSFDVRLAPASGAAIPPTLAFPGPQDAGRPLPTATYARTYGAPAAAASPARRRSVPLIAGLLLAGLVLAAIVIAGLFAVLGGGRSRPVVTIQSPGDNAQITVGQQIVVQATATGARDITRMELYLDGILAGTAASPDPAGQPSLTATQPWTFQQAGPHAITVVAYTADGQASTPAGVNVTVVSSVSELTPTATATTAPTDTSLPTETPSPTATETIIPTDTPTPSATPTALAPVVEFWADQTTISLGESTVLHWHAENVLQIFINATPVTGPDGQVEVMPDETTTYELRAVHIGGVEVRQVTITVEPPGDQTVTLPSQPQLDGIVTNTGVPAGNQEITPGDGEIGGDPPIEVVVRGFMSFDLSSIPENAAIKSVELRFYQVGLRGDPYATLGSLLLKHVDIGDSLNSSDFRAPELGSLDLGQQTAPGSWYTVSTGDLVSWVQDDLAAGRDRTQFRLQFDLDANGDGIVDMALIEGAANTLGSGNVPQLVIVYTP